MSAPINDGGPAFPHINHGGSVLEASGMSLRDYFAGQALNAIAARNTDRTYRDDADEAYSFADAMIAAREVKQ